MTALSATFTPTLRQRARLLLTAPVAALTSATVPSFTLYGGATITGAHDVMGKEYIVCCARNNQTGVFGLYGFQGDTCVLFAPVSGRGSVEVSLYDGKAYWYGWNGSQKFSGVLPGFIPFTPIPAIMQALAALSQDNGRQPYAPFDPISVPATDPLSLLYTGTYTAANTDTPAELAATLNHIVPAIRRIVDILTKQGLIVKV